MVNGTGTKRARWRTWWQRWPCWVGRATMLWAVVYACFGLACALSGTPLLYLGSAPGPSALGWVAVATGSSAALACCAVARYGPRPGLRKVLWAICVPAGIAAFGLLMDVITVVFGQGVDSGVAAANHVLAAAGVLLLAATARSGGRPPAAAVVRAPSAASRPVQLPPAPERCPFSPTRR